MTPAQQPEPSDCEYYNRVGPGLKAFCTHPEKKRRFCKHAIAAGVCPVGIARPHTPAPDESEIRAKILKEVESDEWLEEHDATVARTATLATLDKLQAWRIRRMNGMLKKDVWKGWNEETDFIDSLRRTAQQEHP